jgi:hypothetical protein
MSSLKTVIKISTLRNAFAFIAIVLLVVIPKGGFKVSGIPITWGYLYLGFLFMVLFFSLSKNFIVNQKALICYLATLPFLVYFTVHLAVKGYDGTFGNLVAFYTSFAFMPLLFLVFLSGTLARIDIDYLEKLIYRAVLIVSVYGIFLFLHKQILGRYIEIPYITVNSGDLGELEGKYNQRGNLFKLISTYNNGNIFGVCIMLLFPVFYKKYRKKWELAAVLLALFLTLSRTVWIGVIVFFLIEYRKKLLELIKVYAVVLVAVFVVSSFLFTGLFQYGSLGNFVTDTSFGGRIYQIKDALGFSWFGAEVYNVVNEIVYLSIYRQFGLIGFILFCISMFLPFYIFSYSSKRNWTYFLGVIVYWVLCASDGCTLFIPTLAFYNFVLCMSLVTQRQQNIAEE